MSQYKQYGGVEFTIDFTTPYTPSYSITPSPITLDANDIGDIINSVTNQNQPGKKSTEKYTDALEVYQQLLIISKFEKTTKEFAVHKTDPFFKPESWPEDDDTYNIKPTQPDCIILNLHIKAVVSSGRVDASNQLNTATHTFKTHVEINQHATLRDLRRLLSKSPYTAYHGNSLLFACNYKTIRMDDDTTSLSDFKCYDVIQVQDMEYYVNIEVGISIHTDYEKTIRIPCKFKMTLTELKKAIRKRFSVPTENIQLTRELPSVRILDDSVDMYLFTRKRIINACRLKLTLITNPHYNTPSHSYDRMAFSMPPPPPGVTYSIASSTASSSSSSSSQSIRHIPDHIRATRSFTIMQHRVDTNKFSTIYNILYQVDIHNNHVIHACRCDLALPQQADLLVMVMPHVFMGSNHHPEYLRRANLAGYHCACLRDWQPIQHYGKNRFIICTNTKPVACCHLIDTHEHDDMDALTCRACGMIQEGGFQHSYVNTLTYDDMENQIEATIDNRNNRHETTYLESRQRMGRIHRINKEYEKATATGQDLTHNKNFLDVYHNIPKLGAYLHTPHKGSIINDTQHAIEQHFIRNTRFKQCINTVIAACLRASSLNTNTPLTPEECNAIIKKAFPTGKKTSKAKTINKVVTEIQEESASSSSSSSSTCAIITARATETSIKLKLLDLCNHYHIGTQQYDTVCNSMKAYGYDTLIEQARDALQGETSAYLHDKHSITVAAHCLVSIEHVNILTHFVCTNRVETKTLHKCTHFVSKTPKLTSKDLERYNETIKIYNQVIKGKLSHIRLHRC